MKIFRFALTGLMCVLVVELASAEAPISWRLKPNELLIREARALQSQPEGEQDMGLAQLLARTHIEVTDKLVTRRVTDVLHYSNVDAIQNYGTTTIEFDALTERVTVREAAVLTGAGARIQFDPAQQQIVDTDQYDMFTDRKELVISFSGLEVGSRAILDYEITAQRGYDGMGWSEHTFPQQLVPRTLFEYKVTWNPSEQMSWESSSKWAICEANAGSLVCRGRDIPAAEYDPMVFWRDELGQIAISDTPQWSTVTDRIRAGFDTAMRASHGSEKLLVSLFQGVDTMEEKITRIHEFVARQVRYVSMSEATHRVRPHKVADTLRNRYGDCKDKSAVLVSLLGRVGVNAYPVLVATHNRKPASLLVPSSRSFDHMVVCFAYYNEERCLDATDSHTDWRFIPAWIQGAVSLALVPGATPSTIPVLRYRWDVAIDTAIRLTGTGGQEESQVRTYRGAYAGALRGSLAGITSAERSRWALEQYRDVVSELVEPTFKFQGLEHVDEVVRIHSQAEYAGLIDPERDLNYLDLDAWIRDEIEDVYVRNKVYEVFFPGLRVESTYQLAAAGHWTLNGGGPTISFVHDFGTMTRRITSKDTDTVRILTQIEIPARQLAVRDIREFNKFLDLIKRESVISVLGKRKNGKD